MSTTTPTDASIVRNLTGAMAASSAFPSTPGTTTKPRPVPTPVEIGLSCTKSCSTHSDVASVVTPLIGERFAMSDAQRTKLEAQLSLYFERSGIDNEQVLLFMTLSSSWHVPSTLTDDKSQLNLITVPVTLLLSRIGTYTAVALKQLLFLATGMSYN